MKQKTAKLCNSLVLFLAVIFLFTACSFVASLTLRAPVVMHEEDLNRISWTQNEKAVCFDVYINNEMVQCISQDDSITTYTFDYSSHIEEDGSYKIKVKAIGDGEKYKDSRFSNSVVVYVGENSTGGYDTADLNIVRNSQYAPDNVEYMSEGNTIRWDSFTKGGQNPEKYVIQIYCNEYIDETDNSDKIRTFYVAQNYFVLTDYLKGNEILAISVGCKYPEDESIYVEDVFYYNPLSMGEYSAIYVFDGGVYDYYIEDYAELQNLYHFAYITRNNNLKFLVSNSFYQQHVNDYFSMEQYNYDRYRPYVHQKYIIGLLDSYDKWAYYETYDFSGAPYLMLSSENNINGKVFNLKCEYTYEQPVLNYEDGGYVGLSNKLLSQLSLETPYYEKVDYLPRESNYDNFASDKNVLTTMCTSSEELFWAVENNVTPLFLTTTSRASLVYAEAKKVLRQIISDEMNEYEKILSIFDWIATNTCYDNEGYEDGASTNNTCYYLESVFLDKNRVAVCDGFSKSFSLLCNMEGIDCYRIVGVAGGSTKGGHAWNKVKLDSNWYVVDITWTEIKQSEAKLDSKGNIVYTAERASGNNYFRLPKMQQTEEYNCHKYFLVSDNFISDTHEPFAQRQKTNNSTIPAIKMYGYYTNTSFIYKSEGYSRVIDSNTDMKAVLNYIYQNNISNYEVVIDYTYINSWGYDFSGAIQGGRGNDLFMGVSVQGYLNDIGSTLYALGSTQYVEVDGQMIPCKYEARVEKSAVSPAYYTENKMGYVLYLTCETNIINITKENLDSDNRYSQFIKYIVDNNLDFDAKISFEDAFLKDVLGIDLLNTSHEDLSKTLSEYLINDINKYSNDVVYQVVEFKFDKTEDVQSAVFNGSTFENKEYVAYTFDVVLNY